MREIGRRSVSAPVVQTPSVCGFGGRYGLEDGGRNGVRRPHLPLNGLDGDSQADHLANPRRPRAGGDDQRSATHLAAGCRDAPSAVSCLRRRDDRAPRENPRPLAPRGGCESARRLDRIRLRPLRREHVRGHVGVYLRLHRAGLAGGDYLDVHPPPAHLADALAHVAELRGVVNRGERAGLPELNVEPQIQLHLHEQLQAAHREIVFQVGDAAPSRRADLARVDAGRLARDFAALD